MKIIEENEMTDNEVMFYCFGKMSGKPSTYLLDRFKQLMEDTNDN